ncbi:MAG: hypothetical protein M3Q45_11675 [Chloroflexota bacterium]|nr:hypothetical protein [Chloroflexota bacterium]
MRLESRWTALGGFVRRILLANGIVALLAMIIAWGFGWRTAAEIGLALLLAGGLTALIGAIAWVGGGRVAGDPRYHYARSVMSTPLPARTAETMRDFRASFSFMGLALLVGALLASEGLLLVFLSGNVNNLLVNF